jgi:beta-galactosidase/beta-glucuronidase
MNQSQPLYNITVQLSENGKVSHEKTNRIGFRTVKLIQDHVDAENPVKGKKISNLLYINNKVSVI